MNTDQDNDEKATNIKEKKMEKQLFVYCFPQYNLLGRLLLRNYSHAVKYVST